MMDRSPIAGSWFYFDHLMRAREHQGARIRFRFGFGGKFKRLAAIKA
jgi:hypothetical protein